MKIAVAYIRVSTEHQVEYSPDSQIKLIKDYANKNDFTISEIYSDEGISGRVADKRPAFKKMLADAKRNRFEAILIYNTSRFARNHEESIVYRNMLKRDGVDVISITQPSVDYKTDILMNALYAVMDERYSIELSENVKRGMKEKVSRGKYISCAALGYKRIESNKPLVIDENESAIVRWIFDEYINGNSMFAISKELNRKGYKAKRGSAFDRRGIFRILSNPMYKGYFSWTCDNENYFMKADHEAIIDESTFEKVQEKLRESAKKRHPKSRDSAVCAHWLTGIMRCPVCGTTYVLLKGYNGRADRFRCGKYGNASCTNNHSVKVSDMEALVKKVLMETPIDSSNYIVETRFDNNLETNGQAITERIAQLEKALERAKQAYLQGIDTVEEYGENKAKIISEINILKNSIEAQNAKQYIEKSIEAKIENLILILNADYDNKTKNSFAKDVISRIAINTNRNELVFYFFG